MAICMASIKPARSVGLWRMERIPGQDQLIQLGPKYVHKKKHFMDPTIDARICWPIRKIKKDTWCNFFLPFLFFPMVHSSKNPKKRPQCNSYFLEIIQGQMFRDFKKRVNFCGDFVLNCKFSQPYIQYLVREPAYVQSRLSLVASVFSGLGQFEHVKLCLFIELKIWQILKWLPNCS